MTTKWTLQKTWTLWTHQTIWTFAFACKLVNGRFDLDQASYRREVHFSDFGPGLWSQNLTLWVELKLALQACSQLHLFTFWIVPRLIVFV